MENIWLEQFQPRHSEVDANGELKIRSLCDYLQETAANHATNLNCGIEFLHSKSQLWVLSRLKVCLKSAIKLGDKLTVKTYPSGVNKLFATREFELFVDDESVAYGSSYWLLLSASNLKPLRVMSELPEMPDNATETKFFSELGKISPLSEARASGSITQLVGDSLIDLNNHLNNAEYSAMIHNFLAQVLGKTPQFAELQINFIQATAVNEEMKIMGEVANNSFYVYGMVADSLRFQAFGRLR